MKQSRALFLTPLFNLCIVQKTQRLHIKERYTCRTQDFLSNSAHRRILNSLNFRTCMSFGIIVRAFPFLPSLKIKKGLDRLLFIPWDLNAGETISPYCSLGLISLGPPNSNGSFSPGNVCWGHCPFMGIIKSSLDKEKEKKARKVRRQRPRGRDRERRERTR